MNDDRSQTLDQMLLSDHYPTRAFARLLVAGGDNAFERWIRDESTCPEFKATALPVAVSLFVSNLLSKFLGTYRGVMDTSAILRLSDGLLERSGRDLHRALGEDR